MLEIKCLNESTYIYFNSCMNHGMTRFDTKDRPRWRAHACVDRRQSSRWIGGRGSWGRGPVDHRGGSAHKWANGTARCFKWPKRPCSPLAVHRLRGPHGTVTNKTARPHPGKRRFVLNFSVQRHALSRPHSPRRRLLTCPMPPALFIGRCREVGVCQGEQTLPAVPCKMSALPLHLF